MVICRLGMLCILYVCTYIRYHLVVIHSNHPIGMYCMHSIYCNQVMIVDKKSEEFGPLHISGWLERQKQIVGDPSTSTWATHMKWFKQRHAEAMIWLMRKASKAFELIDKMNKAVSYLHYAGVQAKALNSLMEAGTMAIKAETARKESKRHLLFRCLHARQIRNRVEEAQRFLAYSAKEAVRAEKRLYSKAKLEEEAPKPLPPNYNTIFKLGYMQTMAFQFLKRIGRRAIFHTERQREAQTYFHDLTAKLIHQYGALWDAREWLHACGERGHAHVARQDAVWVQLIGAGHRAIEKMVKWDEALVWLIQRGRQQLVSDERRADMHAYLIDLGRRTVIRVENRERAAQYLLARRTNAVALIRKREQSIAFLQRLPKAFWKNEDRVAAASAWLLDRSMRAYMHTQVQTEVLKKLKVTNNNVDVDPTACILSKMCHSPTVDLRSYFRFQCLFISN